MAYTDSEINPKHVRLRFIIMDWSFIMIKIKNVILDTGDLANHLFNLLVKPVLWITLTSHLLYITSIADILH